MNEIRWVAMDVHHCSPIAMDTYCSHYLPLGMLMRLVCQLKVPTLDGRASNFCPQLNVWWRKELHDPFYTPFTCESPDISKETGFPLAKFGCGRLLAECQGTCWLPKRPAVSRPWLHLSARAAQSKTPLPPENRPIAPDICRCGYTLWEFNIAIWLCII